MPTRISCSTSDMRKRPQQARSRVTIDAIIDATAHILQNRGLDKFNTNSVAEKAGVSIGTLYQYFPNKGALLQALQERHLNDILGVLKAASRPTLSRSERIMVFAEGMIDAHFLMPPVFESLQEMLPKKHTTDSAFHAQYSEAYKNFTRLNALTPLNFISLDRVLESSVAGVIHQAVVERFLVDPLFKGDMIKIIESLLD